VRDIVAELMAQAEAYDLEVCRSYRHACLDDVVPVYNGIGPEWLPKALRELLTDRFGYFAPAALIHDWDFAKSEDRSMLAFAESNNRLRRNCRKLVKMKGCPWYKRPLYLYRCDMLADICHEMGYSAWNAA
jgi:hypothetical protein